jgi:transposase
MKSSTSYVGLDVHKSTISVAIAEDGRSGDIRDYGVIENRADILVKLVGVWVGTGNGCIFAMRRAPVVMDFIGC